MTRGSKKNLALRIATLCLCLLAAAGAHAQIPQQTTPQTVTAILATNLACTGVGQIFSTSAGIPNFDNLGQTQHYAYLKTTGIQTLAMQMFGLDASGNTFLISETATIGAVSVGNNPVLTGTGYYPNFEIVVTCSPNGGTFTLTYTGTSSTSNINAGGYQLTQENKTIANAAPANAGVSQTFQAPFGNALGYLSFTYAPGAGPIGSQIGVRCSGATGNPFGIYAWDLTTGTVAVIPVPDTPCPIITVTYVSGGATADTFSLDYVFLQPGSRGTNSYTHITGTTATVVKIGSGTVHSVVVGTPAAGTITLFDLAPAQCTGTPITNIVSVITATATFPAAPEIYDVFFQNGICAKASATMDITISSQ